MEIKQLFTALIVISFASSIHAATSKHLSHRIDATTLESVEIVIPVVEMKIEVYDGNAIEIEIDVRSQRRMWLFGRKDVDDIDLEINRQGNDLILSIDENNLNQTWEIRIPRNLALEMNIGVGEVSLEQFANDLDMELGVGEVRVMVDDTEYRSIDLSVGVGETIIRGFDNSASSEREIVSQRSRYGGSGDYRMDIEVGVGEARVVNR
jgi:hypothetical protein